MGFRKNIYTSTDKWKIAFAVGCLFIIFASPLTHNFLGLSTTKCGISALGLVFVAIVFVLIIRFIIN